MIDLHSHILPAVDDGAASLEVSLEMARLAVADGIAVMACTPHFMKGVYDTEASTVATGVETLARHLARHRIPLGLVGGGDIHASPCLAAGLAAGTIPSLGGSRYFLFEPPHHVLLPGLLKLVRLLISAGFVPVLTHPERLTWIDAHYDVVCEIGAAGAAVQITAASITGGFGRRPRYWSERMLDEARVDLVASDAHDAVRRPPLMSNARERVAARIGEDAAERLFNENPCRMLADLPLPPKPRGAVGPAQTRQTHRRWLKHLLDPRR